MKKGLLILCAVLYVAMCGMLVLACEHADNTPDSVMAKIDKSKFKKCKTVCANRPPGKGFEISEACAKCMEKNFDDKGDLKGLQVMKQEKTRGFRIEIAEIKQVLDSIEADGTAELYAMLAVRDTTIGKKDSLMPELVFQIVPTAKATDAEIAAGSQYFDFTRPCPNWCPKVD